MRGGRGITLASNTKSGLSSLEPAVDGPRADADLVQFRTRGYLARNAFQNLSDRIRPVRPGALGASDAAPGVLLAALLDLRVITEEEMTCLAARV